MEMIHYFEAKDGTEIEVVLSIEMANDGIGYYQYGSQHCYDSGATYVDSIEVESISDEAYLREFEDWMLVKENMNHLETKVWEEINNCEDSRIPY